MVGKDKIYLKDDAAKAAFMAENPNHKKEFQRLKGLGEMDWEELQETTIDPTKRTLLKVVGRAGGHRRRGPLGPHGRRRREPQALHPDQRQGREVPGHMTPSPPPDGRDETLFEEEFEPIEIQEEMERSFLDYSMSVIVSRALPDARDGLKPVHRRILWGMHDLGARPDRPTIKCARVTGDVMGKYHPHGDSAIYDALVRMGQTFSLRHPLIHPKGNFGTPDDPPAAARYTECRLAEIAMAMLDGIDEDTVDFVDNYSGEFQEPSLLPARFPNLLVNGSQGIAVGMATNIPPHNLGEVIDATNHLIDHPDATPDDLMQFIKGPDFPTGALMMGRQGILDAYRTGRGSIRLRAVAEIEEGKRNDMIVVSKLPYQVSPSHGPDEDQGAGRQR